MLGSAIIVSVLYERQSWCLYLCGLGGMVGVLAKTALVELRADRNVCISQCGSNECYLGTSDQDGCPFGNAGPRLHSNRLCSLCAACVKNCPHGAINLNLRFPARELWELRRPNTGTAFLVIGLIGGLLSEMAGKTEVYAYVTGFLPIPKVVAFTVVVRNAIAAGEPHADRGRSSVQQSVPRSVPRKLLQIRSGVAAACLDLTHGLSPVLSCESRSPVAYFGQPQFRF